MSKKWITFLVAAAVGALLLVPTAALANVCQISIVGQLTWTTTGPVATNSDPTSVTPGQLTTTLVNKAGGIGPIDGGSQVAAEGLGERLADQVIYDPAANAVNACFTPNATIVISFNGSLAQLEAGTTNVNNASFIDVFDSAGAAGVTVSSATLSPGFAANQPTTLLTIVLGNAAGSGRAGVGTYGFDGVTGAAIRIKNLYIDSSTILTGSPGSIGVAPAATSKVPATATVAAAAGAPTAIVYVNPAAVNFAVNIVGVLNVTNSQTTPNVDPVTSGLATAFENAGTGLTGGFQALGWTPNATISDEGGAYRQVAANASGIANDQGVGSTNVLFHVSNIPSGSDVQFPTRLNVVSNGGNTITTYLLSSSGTLDNNSTAASLSVLYNTVTATNALGGLKTALTIETADNADGGTFTGAASSNPNCTASGKNLNAWSRCNGNPKIRVFAGTTSVPGLANIDVLVGPTNAANALKFADGTSDDTSGAASFPRYVGTNLPSASAGVFQTGVGARAANIPTTNLVATRVIELGANFFEILPSRTALLFPFASTGGNFDAGLAVTNACADANVFLGGAATGFAARTTNFCGQTGSVTFYLFGTTADAARTPVVDAIGTDALAASGKLATAGCRGFNTANGKLAPGQTGACVLSTLLPLFPTAPASFEGYIIAVGRFLNGHGVYAFFNNQKNPFAYNSALVMGGGVRGQFVSEGFDQ